MLVTISNWGFAQYSLQAFRKHPLDNNADASEVPIPKKPESRDVSDCTLMPILDGPTIQRWENRMARGQSWQSEQSPRPQ